MQNYDDPESRLLQFLNSGNRPKTTWSPCLLALVLRSISLVEVLEEVLLVHLALHNLALVSGPHGQLREKKEKGVRCQGWAKWILQRQRKLSCINQLVIVQGGPSASGKIYVDIKFKVPSLAWVTG